MDGLFLTSRRHWWEWVNSTLTAYHLSETSRSYRARTWMDRLADRDATNCAISPPPLPMKNKGMHCETREGHVTFISLLKNNEKQLFLVFWESVHLKIYMYRYSENSFFCGGRVDYIDWLIMLIDWLIESYLRPCLTHAGHRDRQKPANGTQCPTLMTDS